MSSNRLLGLKEDLYAKSFLCSVPIYIHSCEADSLDESYHFEIEVRFHCKEFMNYLKDFADVIDTTYYHTNNILRVCFS